MRALAALAGFSVGAYLMWTVVEPVRGSFQSCRPGAICQGSVMTAQTAPAGLALSIVLYDPNADAELPGKTH